MRGTIWDLVHLGGLWILGAAFEAFLLVQAIAVGEPPDPSPAWQWTLLTTMGAVVVVLILVTWRILAEWRATRDQPASHLPSQ
jgi:hypothetical protein